MRNLTTIVRGLYNKPALVSQEYANDVFTALDNKDLTLFGDKIEGELSDKLVTTHLMEEVVTPNLMEDKKRKKRKRAMMLEIDGALTYKRQLSHSAMTSYIGMKASFNYLVEEEPDITTWIMDLNTQGGMAYQCFETARYIRELADFNGKTLIAYVDGQASSAGYAFAAIADEIIVNPMANVGSIGVVVTLRNDLPKEIADGKERIFITSGSEKRPFTETGNIKPEKIAEIQEEVNALGIEFNNHVAAYRPLTPEAVGKLEASSFTAEKALKLGLIDKIMEREEFFSYITSQEEEDVTTINEENENLSDQNDALKELTKKLEVLEATNTELTAKNDKLSGVLTKFAEEQAAARHMKLVSTLSEFSFVEDATKLAGVVTKLDTVDKAVLMATFTKAGEAVPTASATADEEDMFEMVSTGVTGDLTELSDMSAEVSKLLDAKYGGAK